METRLAKVMEQQTEKEIKEKGLLKEKDILMFVTKLFPMLASFYILQEYFFIVVFLNNFILNLSS